MSAIWAFDRIFLFYSNRRPEDAPFLEDLQVLERENSNYKLIATMTEMTKSLAWRNGPDQQGAAFQVFAGGSVACLLHCWATKGW
jgi:hypothetical protein